MTGSDAPLSAPITTDRAFRLPRAAWAFVVLAAIEALLVSRSLEVRVQLVPALVVDWGRGTPGVLLGVLARVSTVLLPAAILYRAPEAWSSHRLLLLGTGLIAVWTVALPVLIELAFGGPEMASWASLIPLLGLLYVAGTLLVAIGLLRLRRGSPSTRAHLIGLLAIIAVPLPDILAATAAGVQIQPGPMLAAVASAIAGGYLLSVPIGAWIDGEAARPFWPVLAVIALFQLAVPLLNAATIFLATRGTEPATYSPTGLTGIVAGGAALVTLWAYARALPEPASEPT